MTNYGNTGQRYKMSKILGVIVEGDTVQILKECGHNYTVPRLPGETDEDIASWYNKYKGTRRRCDECKDASNA